MYFTVVMNEKKERVLKEDRLIDCLGFFAVSAIFQLCYGGDYEVNDWLSPFGMKHNMYNFRSNNYYLLYEIR